jgi:hypothetical protein
MVEPKGAESTTIPVDAADLADVGVLLVHGIGEQRKSDTLLEVGEALRRWTGEWLASASGGDARLAARILHAELTPRAEVHAPAHALLGLRPPSGPQQWLIAESWWAEAFKPPLYRDLVKWFFQILPWSLTSHIYRRVKLAAGYRKLVWIFALLVAVPLLPVLVSLFGCTLLLGVIPVQRLRSAIHAFQKKLLGTVGDSYALLGGSMRGAAMFTSVEHDLKWLQRRCRDHNVVIVAHSQGAAVAHAMLQHLGVDAHGDPPKRFVTYGAGIQKLMLLDQLHARQILFSWCLSFGLLVLAWGAWGTIYFHWTGQQIDVDGLFGLPQTLFGFDLTNIRGFNLLSAYGSAVLGLLLGFGQGLTHGDEIRERLVAALIVGAIYAVMFVAMYFVATAHTGLFVILGSVLTLAGALLGGYGQDLAARLALPWSIPWADFYATSDPVPNGPLHDGPRSNVSPTSTAVRNRGSTLKDHTTYWQNNDEFVTAVALEIAAASGQDFATLTTWDRRLIERAKARRRWRVLWLQLTQAALVLSAVMLAYAFRERLWTDLTHTPGFIKAIAEETLNVINLIPFVKLIAPATPPGLTPEVLWFSMAIVLTYLILKTAQYLWTWWDDAEASVFLCRRDFEAAPGQFTSLLLLLLTAVVVGALAHPGATQLLVQLAADPDIAAIRQRGVGYYGDSGAPMGILSVVVNALSTAVIGGVASAYVLAQGRHGIVLGDAELSDAMEWLRRTRTPARIAVAFILTLPLYFFAFRVWSARPLEHGATSAGWLWIAGVLIAVAIMCALTLAADACGLSTLMRRLGGWTCAGGIGSYLARRRDAGAYDDLMQRGREIAAVAAGSIARSDPAWIVRSDEAEDIVVALAGAQDAAALRVQNDLIARFPLAAIALARRLAAKRPREALEMLKPHMTTAPWIARRRARSLARKIERRTSPPSAPPSPDELAGTGSVVASPST